MKCGKEEIIRSLFFLKVEGGSIQIECIGFNALRMPETSRHGHTLPGMKISRFCECITSESQFSQFSCVGHI